MRRPHSDPLTIGSKPPGPTSQVRARLSTYAEECGIELIFFDPAEHFDRAIVGVVYGYGQEPAVLYDEAMVIAAMVADGMDEEEAREWFEFNTIGSYIGAATPRFLICQTRQRRTA